MNQTLAKKVMSGSAWLIATNIGLRGASVISTMVLAWLLTPVDFGIVAMASIVTMVMTSLTEVGMNQVMVYYRDVDRSFFDTAWTIQALRGLALCIVLLLIAEPIALFFSESRLVPVLRVLSVGFLLDGLVSIGMAKLFREMRFDLEFRYRIITRAVGLTSAIVLALWLRNYWAMVLSNIMAALARVGLSFFYAPHFSCLTLRHWRKIFGFSQWVFLRESVGLVAQKIDQILLGRWLGSDLLGQYSMAFEVASLPATGIAMPMARSLLPAFGSLQKQPERFRNALTTSLAALLLISLPSSCGLIMVAEPLIKLFLPPSWKFVGSLIQILSIYGLIRITFGPCGAALTSMGRVREVFFISAANLLLKCVILYVGYICGGILGIAWGTAISTIPTSIFYLWTVCHHSYLDIRVLLKQVWRTLLASTLMATGVWGIQQIAEILRWNQYVVLTIMVGCGILFYTLALFLLWRLAGKPDGIETLVFKFLTNLKK